MTRDYVSEYLSKRGYMIFDDLFGWNVGIRQYDYLEKDESENYFMVIEVPGFKKDDVKITFEKNLLKVKASKKKGEKEIKKEGTWYLPNFIDYSTASAKLEDGELKITFSPVKKDIREVTIE